MSEISRKGELIDENEIKGCIKALGKLIFSLDDVLNEAVEFLKNIFNLVRI